MRVQPLTRLGGIVAAIGLIVAAPAAAVAPAEATESCPSTALNVYFASGDTPLSDEARALLGKLRETAASCRPDRIDLIARFDARAEGPSAELRARSKLALLVNILVDAGIPPAKIHISTRGASTADRGYADAGRLHVIEVQFNGASPANGDAGRVAVPSPTRI